MNALNAFSPMSAAVAQPVVCELTWEQLRRWTVLRNTAISLLLVFLFHDFLLRIFGVLYLPSLTGISISPFFCVESMTLCIVALGLWRLRADPAYRERFRQPFIRWLLICGMVAFAFISLHVVSVPGLLSARALLYAPYLFALGYFVGVDRETVFHTLLIAALVNAIAVLILGFFLKEQYEWLLVFYDKALPGFESLYGKVHRHVKVAMPTGLIVYRLPFRTLFTLVGVMALHRALHLDGFIKQRWILGLAATASYALVLGTFSRSGMITTTLLYAFVTLHWMLKARRYQQIQLRFRYAGASIGLVTLVLVAISAVYLAQSVYNIDLLDPRSLTDEKGGRMGQWVYIAENLTRKGGWVAGTATGLVKHSGGPRERVWSEISYFTVDNQFLSVILGGGILGFAAYIGFLGLAMRQFFKWNVYPEALILVAATLIEANLETGSLLLPVVMLLAAGQLSERIGKQPTKLTNENTFQAAEALSTQMA